MISNCLYFSSSHLDLFADLTQTLFFSILQVLYVSKFFNLFLDCLTIIIQMNLFLFFPSDDKNINANPCMNKQV